MTSNGVWPAEESTAAIPSRVTLSQLIAMYPWRSASVRATKDTPTSVAAARPSFRRRTPEQNPAAVPIERPLPNSGIVSCCQNTSTQNTRNHSRQIASDLGSFLDVLIRLFTPRGGSERVNGVGWLRQSSVLLLSLKLRQRESGSWLCAPRLVVGTGRGMGCGTPSDPCTLG